MAKELIDLDPELLAAAAELYGTGNSEETVNAALRDAAERQGRLDAFDSLAEMAAAGALDDLLDKRSYRR